MLQPLSLAILQSFLYWIPHWAMGFLRARLCLFILLSLQLLALGSSGIYSGYIVIQEGFVE